MLTPEKIAQFDKITGSSSFTPTTPGKKRANEIRALVGIQSPDQPSNQGPEDYLKIKANPNISWENGGLTDVLSTPLKSIANFATFPIRAASTAGAAIQAGADLVKEQGILAPSRALLDTGAAMEGSALKLLAGIGNTFLGALQKGLKTVGINVPDPEAEKAINIVTEHLLNNKLADATDVATVVHKWVTENPEQVMLAAQQLNRVAGKDVVAETAQKFGSNQIQAGVDTAINAAGDTVSGIGRGLKGAAEKLYEHAITPNTQEAENLLDYRSKHPFLERVRQTLTGEAEPPQTRASTALNKGIAGTEGHIGTEARSLKNKIWKEQLGPALDESKAVMAKDDLFNSAAKRVAETVEPAKRAAFQDAYDALQDEYKDINNIPVRDVQSIKSTLDKFTPDKLWRGKPVANEYNVLRADMANDARQFIYNALPGDDVRGVYADWSNLNALEDVGVKAISNAGFKGGAGTLVGHLWDAATTPIKTIGGQVLYKVGNAFEFLGDKGIKTFGEFLSGKGFTPPPLGGEIGGNNTQPPNNGPKYSDIDNNIHSSNSITDKPNMQAGFIKNPLGNGSISTKDFKVGDVIKTSEGETRIIREIKGNSAYFIDPEGQTYHGFPRTTLRDLINGGAWKLNENQLPNMQAGFIRNPLAGSTPEDNLTWQEIQWNRAKAAAQPTVEQMSEQAGGWTPGLKVQFDTALNHGDAATLMKLIPQAPADYVTKFAENIKNVLNGVKKKTIPMDQGAAAINGVSKEAPNELMSYVRSKYIKPEADKYLGKIKVGTKLSHPEYSLGQSSAAGTDLAQNLYPIMPDSWANKVANSSIGEKLSPANIQVSSSLLAPQAPDTNGQLFDPKGSPMNQGPFSKTAEQIMLQEIAGQFYMKNRKADPDLDYNFMKAWNTYKRTVGDGGYNSKDLRDFLGAKNMSHLPAELYEKIAAQAGSINNIPSELKPYYYWLK